VRHNWVRDIADFAKYGLLKRLAGEDLRLGVFWYLTTHADANPPLVSYLSRPERYRACDAALFDTLRGLHIEKGDKLTLEDIERGEVLPGGTVFYGRPLSTAFGGAMATRWACLSHPAQPIPTRCDGAETRFSSTQPGMGKSPPLSLDQPIDYDCCRLRTTHVCSLARLFSTSEGQDEERAGAMGLC
jgi:hypothetical protein